MAMAITHTPIVITVIGVRGTGVMVDGVIMVIEVRVMGVMGEEVVLGVQVPGVRGGTGDNTFFSQLHCSV
jgi:hypothetical protein